MGSDDKVLVEEVESMKKVAFFGVAVSTVATIAAIIAVPMLYNYMHHVQSSLEVEADFCQLRTGKLYEEFNRVR
ncbi:unnamed protein product [Anisakis simplex]|uniref:Col_cuticle_N domain-containing protein n=1 Tax=Anisakis simplex TaxID=6269 RepID=A0A0M3JQB5_ANISI|nr:unnamed protein product [Anisakis simplex]VDK40664.1 unnamed protein product [Anisakis simplex]